MRSSFKRMVCNTVPTPIRPAIYQDFRGCKFKDYFLTREKAQEVCDSIIQDGDDTDPSRKLRPYKCDKCFRFHNGHERSPRYASSSPRVSQGLAGNEGKVCVMPLPC